MSESKDSTWKTLANTWKQKFDKAEAERKILTEELSAERNKVRNAEMRLTELKRDLAQSRLAPEKANQEKDEAANKVKDTLQELAETEL